MCSRRPKPLRAMTVLRTRDCGVETAADPAASLSFEPLPAGSSQTKALQSRAWKPNKAADKPDHFLPHWTQKSLFFSRMLRSAQEGYTPTRTEGPRNQAKRATWGFCTVPQQLACWRKVVPSGNETNYTAPVENRDVDVWHARLPCFPGVPVSQGVLGAYTYVYIYIFIFIYLFIYMYMCIRKYTYKVAGIWYTMFLIQNVFCTICKAWCQA